MTRRQWSLVIVMILINYLIFSQLFQRIMDTAPAVGVATATAVPTFTPSPVPVIPPTPTDTPVLAPPTPTNTPVIMSDEQKRLATATQEAANAAATAQAAPPPPTATPTPEDRRPLVTAADGAVNLRAGPGTNYPRAGSLPQGQSLEIVGRNADSSWWQVSTSGGLAWISAGVTSAQNADNTIPVVDAPPPPAPPTSAAPTAAPQPTAPPAPQFQYSVRNIFPQVNEGITQVRGEIRDAAGNPVDGIRVRVRSGTFCTVAYPSGTPGVYPQGVYDVLLDNHAKDGNWQVAIVNGPSNPEDTACNDGLGVLSEEVSVPTNTLEGVVFVEWTKNY